MTTATDHDRAGNAGPDPMAVEALEQLVETPMHEPLPPDVERWARIALLTATIDRRPWGDALGLDGEQGRDDGRAIVRRRIRDRRLAELGEVLNPGEAAAVQARAIRRAVDRLTGVPLFEVDAADLPAARLLRQAEAFAPVPMNRQRLAQAILRGRLPETVVSGK